MFMKKKIQNVAILLAGLAATSLMAETATTPVAAALPKKTVQKKSISRKAGLVTRREAKEDRLTTPQSSAISAANATTSLPGMTAGTSSAAAPKAMQKKTFADNIRASVLFEYFGGSVSDPLSGWQTDKESGYSQGGSSHELDTRLTLGFAATSNMTLSYNAYFWSHSDSPGKSDGESFRFRAADSFLMAKFGKFYQAGKFKWNGEFRFYPGLGSDYKNRVAYYRTGQNFMYSLSPRATLAAYNSIRYYHNNDSAYAIENDAEGNKVDARLTLSPTFEYQVTDTIGASISYNMDFAHTHRNNTIAETEHYKGADYGAYFEVGGSIDLTKRINLNPYIDMFTHTMNVEAMQLGANLNLSIL